MAALPTYDQIMLSTGVMTILDTSGAITQPRPVGNLVELSFEYASTSKELRNGSVKYAVDVATTQRKLSGKAKLKSTYAAQFASILPDTTVTTGGTVNFSEVKAAAASVTVTNTTGFQDLGVLDHNGILMTRVSSAPTAGQYSVTSGGVFSFNASETGNLTFMYSYTTSTGFTATHTNGATGSQVTAQIVAFNNYTTQNGNTYAFGLKFNCVKITKISVATKVDEHVEFDIEFDCFPDLSGNVTSTYWSK